MDNDQFKAMFDFGSSGEQVVGDWLQTKRVAHFALHTLGQLDGGGPRVTMSDGTTVACPDFICWGAPPHPAPPAAAGHPAPPAPPAAAAHPAPLAADQFFIEVKRFKRWWEPGGGVKQTGIQATKVAEYKALATATGKSVYVYFLQINELMQGDGLFFADLSTLPVAGETTPPGGYSLSMFNATDLIKLAEQAELAWFDPAPRPEEPDDEP